MTDPLLNISRTYSRNHIFVPWAGQQRNYRGKASPRGNDFPRDLDRGNHASRLRTELTQARNTAVERGAHHPAELRPDGFTLCVEGWSEDSGYALALQQLGANGAALLAVQPATEHQAERALLWMPFDAVRSFFRKLDQYATQETSKGDPRNAELIANIVNLRLATLRELWQEGEEFPVGGEGWWEVWLTRGRNDEPDPTAAIARAATELPGIRFVPPTLVFPERTIPLIRASPTSLGALLTTSVVIAELRRPRLSAELLDADQELQRDFARDLAARVVPADPDAPAVCLLDTGISAEHPLLRDNCDSVLSALQSTETSADRYGHGTAMGGIALYGDLNDALSNNKRIWLRNRIESVKILRSGNNDDTPPEQYGTVTASAAAAIEVERIRRRVFAMPVTTQEPCPRGHASSWSATVDALAVGTDVETHNNGQRIEFLDVPDLTAPRLIAVSAGNIWPYSKEPKESPLALSDASPLKDPAQAWNALTVGAYTRLTNWPQDPSIQDQLQGWQLLAQPGDLSPLSRTSVPYRNQPLKPDIVCEGGNLLIDPAGNQPDTFSSLGVPTTRSLGIDRPSLLTSVHGTSPATAEAAHLAALIMERYPNLWPETVRGLLVHAARWTRTMWKNIEEADTKRARRKLLQRYGWGVPAEERALAGASSSVTMIVQEELQPFMRNGNSIAYHGMRLHHLPWPTSQLQALGSEHIRMRVTLSYFVEPNPSGLNWNNNSRYPSHQLRFDVKRPTESVTAFTGWVSNRAQQPDEEEPQLPESRDSDKRDWLVGTQERHRGSLHVDQWTGTAADVADSNVIAVRPTTGWWKENNRRDRAELTVRYALLVSLETTTVDADIYTPIANEIENRVAVETEIPT